MAFIADLRAARLEVLARVAWALEKTGREPGAVTLTAVTKGQPWSSVAALLAAGQTVFGENRVQEAQARWKGKRDGLELRLIGPLQTNKVAAALALFDVIETLDRPRLAAALAIEAERSGRALRVFVQVNTGEEPQKGGVAPRDLGAFMEVCRRDHGLRPEGLMCIPPADEPPAPHFAFLGKLAADNGVSGLSMGMSGDFEVAVRFGATHVRVGSALFGDRDLAA